jgi:hypothetical protein
MSFIEVLFALKTWSFLCLPWKYYLQDYQTPFYLHYHLLVLLYGTIMNWELRISEGKRFVPAGGCARLATSESSVRHVSHGWIQRWMAPPHSGLIIARPFFSILSFFCFSTASKQLRRRWFHRRAGFNLLLCWRISFPMLLLCWRALFPSYSYCMSPRPSSSTAAMDLSGAVAPASTLGSHHRGRPWWGVGRQLPRWARLLPRAARSSRLRVQPPR